MAQQKDAILNKMNGVLDQLIENAKKLNDLSRQVIAEEEISPLQEQQQELLNILVDLDDSFHQADSNLLEEKNSPLQNIVNEKIEAFQQLNTSFVENIMSSQGLIQFKPPKPRKTKK